MNLIVALIVLSTLAVPFRTAGQTTEPQQTPPTNSPTSVPPQVPSPASPPVPTAERPVSWKVLLPNLISDQERIWTFPARLVQGQNWISTTAVLGTTAGLLALEPTEAAYFRRTSTFQSFNNIFSGNDTVIAILTLPRVGWNISKYPDDPCCAKESILRNPILKDPILRDP